MCDSAVLEPLEQNLITASSGTQALRQVPEHDFAVILLDVQMPDMSGIEAAAMIRERERSKSTPIIFLTSVVKTAEMMFKGYSAGAVDYLMKPVISGVLRAKVEVFVELAQVRQSLHQEIAERARIAADLSKLNMMLEQRNEDLMAANSDLEAFSQSVSHDLRMPLRHIKAYVSMIEESALAKLSADEGRRLKGVRDAAVRMSQLIDDLLAFSTARRPYLGRIRAERRCDLLLQPANARQSRIADGRTPCRNSGGPDAIGRESAPGIRYSTRYST